jgi:Protein of unknown function (DUF2442)
MSIAAVELKPLAVEVSFTNSNLEVVLADGRKISVPLIWFPVLHKATTEQKNNWNLIGEGLGIEWKDVAEVISVERLMRFR